MDGISRRGKRMRGRGRGGRTKGWLYAMIRDDHKEEEEEREKKSRAGKGDEWMKERMRGAGDEMKGRRERETERGRERPRRGREGCMVSIRRLICLGFRPLAPLVEGADWNKMAETVIKEIPLISLFRRAKPPKMCV